jgi:hypothetical protein
VGTVLVPMLGERQAMTLSVSIPTCIRPPPFGEENDTVAAIPAIQKDVRDVTHADIEGFNAILHLAGIVQ